MSFRRMHADEVETDVRLVRALLEEQFPQWAALPLEPVPSFGTDNALYRIGEALVARLPRRAQNVDQIHKEATWLPRLAPHLPVAVPVTVAVGRPGAGFPFEWAVYPWLEGENPQVGRLSDPEVLARELATFVVALREIDPAGGPRTWRGEPLRTRDAPTRAAIAQLGGSIDADAATAAWERALRAPDWSGRALWLHADIGPGNVLVRDGRLAAVIDFGTLGIGDPACDLIVAWNLLPAETRGVFRAEVHVDDATWERGLGWALSVALLAIPYYDLTNPTLAGNGRHVLGEILD